MALPPAGGVFPAQKGDSISVKVAEATGDAIVIEFVVFDKVFRGVLLQEDPSFNQYGINLDRVRGAPFWPAPSVPTGGVSLKAIPCSTERYSYKHEGQSSNLNVFQPEAIKRGSRHQPAPQLSRILRPRRFVCRKCKKAYHVEENGVEMSSEAISLQMDPVTVDSTAFTCETESAHVNESAQFDSKYPRRNCTLPPLINDGLSQSIRQVTPPIMPKLTEDYALNGRDSEVDSNSDDAVVKRTKLPPVEKTNPSFSTLNKTTILARRKADPSSSCQRQKKLKRVSKTPNRDKTVQVPFEASHSTLGKFCEVVSDSSSAVCREKLRAANLDQLEPATSAPPPTTGSNEAQVRKNRIKAQYVSVATPFRFPPSRSSKPDLLSNTQFSNSFTSGKTITAPKCTAHNIPPLTTNCNKTAGRRNVVAPDPRLNLNGAIKPLQEDKSAPSSSACSVRHRSRTRSALRVISKPKPEERDLPLNASKVDDVIVLQPKASAPIGGNGNAQLEKVNEALSVPHSSATCEPSAAVLTVSEPDSADSSVSLTVSQPSTTIDPTPLGNRLKVVDYEKPKNRWIREARARRPQEDRPSSVPVSPNLNSASSVSPSTLDLPASSIDHPNSSVRLRTRSSEGAPNVNVAGTVPLKTGVSKRRATSTNVEGNPSGQKLSVSGVTDQTTRPSSSHAPPQPSDSAVVGLPVLKIKINRPSQLTSGVNSFTQYEVVELPMPNGSEVHSSQAVLDVAATSKSGSASVSSVNEVTESKGDTSSNGLSSSPSSRKGPCSANSPSLGRPVKRCRLSDGVTFRVGDLVWSKLSGWPSWPAQITSIHRVSSDDSESVAPSTEYDFTDGQPSKTDSSTSSKRFSYTACLHWFAWHQVSYMPCDKLFHFLQHYKRFDNKKKRGVFRHAVNEAKQKSEEKQLLSSISSDSDSADEAPIELTSQSVCAPPTSNVGSGQASLSPETALSLPTGSSTIELSSSIAPSDLPEEPTSILPSPVKLSSRSITTTIAPRARSSNRGRPCRLRGRRGGSANSADRTRSSPRNLPTFLPSGPRAFENPSHPANLPPLRLTIPSNGRKFFRGRQRRLGRGRGSISARGTLNAKVLPSNLSFYAPSDTHSFESSGTLKMVLSASKFKAPRRQNSKRKSFSSKQPKRDQNSFSVRERSEVQTTQNAIPTSSHTVPCESIISVPTYPLTVAISSASGPSAELELSVPTPYDDSSAEILSQFPQVFPDLRASGILPNSVVIPTFSEDESEEEDAGRLIIDPDVMASVNVTGSSSIDRYRHSETVGFQGSFHSSSVLMDPVKLADQLRTDNYLSLDPAGFEHMSHSSLPDSMFQTPPVSALSCDMHPHSGFPAPCSTSSVSSVHAIASLVPHCALRTPNCDHLLSPISALSHNPPISESYFRHSSHAGVSVSSPNTMVPYVASDFTML